MARLAALPAGSTNGIAENRRYMVTKTLFSGGRSVKLVAKELGGSDYISLNVYHLSSGPRLIPCEMSRVKVVHFLLVLRITDQDAA
ncbi:hypothetical protein [Roseobacter cerasinus]|uniref:hypothetical protein n=1 Tax=Roseobacter cerasinus TaxID=2602289 RepID=UPI001359E780|nr:hypothetical protein [Roseobacter cerasinus]